MTYLMFGFLTSSDWTCGWILVATSAIATLIVETGQSSPQALSKTSSIPLIIGAVEGTSSILTTSVSPLPPVLETTQEASRRPPCSYGIETESTPSNGVSETS